MIFFIFKHRKNVLKQSLILLFLGYSMISWANPILDQIHELAKTRNPEHSEIRANSQPLPVDALQKIRENYEFVIFYRTSCPHCRQFAPVITQFVQDQGWILEAISTDGEISMAFPPSLTMTPGLKEVFFGKDSQVMIPALFLLNRTNGHVYSVSQGELTEVELQKRIQELLPEIESHEKNLSVKGSERL